MSSRSGFPPPEYTSEEAQRSCYPKQSLEEVESLRFSLLNGGLFSPFLFGFFSIHMSKILMYILYHYFYIKSIAKRRRVFSPSPCVKKINCTSTPGLLNVMYSVYSQLQGYHPVDPLSSESVLASQLYRQAFRSQLFLPAAE